MIEVRLFFYLNSFKILTIYAAFCSSNKNNGGGWSYQSFCAAKLLSNNF
ncbi:putative signal peptide protein [Puccinia sorghi]|uniref:Putative signal peptide protein n=1 Tax=Puccinia sorghi TaxID=27349 RepID=A0A0L6VIH8_9BASI|nr:putative signal peptide protein [Puccinia sorghi]